MTIKEFFNRVNNSKKDIIQKFVDILNKEKIEYAVISGIGVKAYCEPVITADFDCIVANDKLNLLKELLKKEGFKLKNHPYTIEVTSPDSDLRIQIQKEQKFQAFLKNATLRSVIGYRLKVASKKDILTSKISAYLERTRAPEKRVKDLSDIIRLVKTNVSLKKYLPEEIKEKIKEFSK